MEHELIVIGKTIRVESGPARKTAIATKELLDDKVTAEHYKVGALDAGAEGQPPRPIVCLLYTSPSPRDS